MSVQPRGDSLRTTRREFWRGAMWNLASRITAVLLGLAILVIVARLGPGVQGAFSLFVAVEGALIALGSGLGLLLAREAARTSGQLPGRRLAHVLAIAVVAGVLAAGVLVLASRLASGPPFASLWLLALAAPFLLLAPTVSGLWMGRGDLKSLNIVQVASPALVMLLLLAATTARLSGLTAALGAWILGRTVVGLLAAIRALACSPEKPVDESGPGNVTAMRDAWRFLALIALANIISLANYRAMLFLMEGMQGLSVAGTYSVAVQVAELLWLLSWAVTVSSYSAVGSGDAARAAASTACAVRAGLLAVMAAAPLLAVAAWLLLPRMLGEPYRASIAPLLVLMPGVAAYAAASALSAYYTQHHGRPHWAAGIAALSLTLAVAVGFWSIPRWGAIGGALATSIGYLVAIGFALRRFGQDTGFDWNWLLRGHTARQQRTT
jgi:O-antigen/teichoic acid export membrane protein